MNGIKERIDSIEKKTDAIENRIGNLEKNMLSYYLLKIAGRYELFEQRLVKVEDKQKHIDAK
ncbi:hypothetical protein C1645_781961 [Glomus cerebriforme]|uniref:Uncharacterized protein n=1 Tax=Glomus cerebriforme TaxID=658196 RepID=A0A397SKF2_9GLOM|nr:hypothetical protein C1645_781961 [Glomus cerebriforme]